MTKNNQRNHSVKKKKIDPELTGIDAPLMKGDLLLLPLMILSILCVIVFAPLTSLSLSPNFSTFILLSPFVTVCFGFIYAYRTFRRQKRSLFTRIMAGVPLALLAGAFVLTLFSTSGGSSCTGFFGTPTNCVEMQHFALLAFFFNPFVLPILAVTSLAGIISTLTKDRKYLSTENIVK